MTELTKIPFGSILSTIDLGKVLRAKRKVHDMTQKELAKAASVGVRFVSELENGKQTAEIQKVLQVVNTLGLELSVHKPHFRKVAKMRA